MLHFILNFQRVASVNAFRLRGLATDSSFQRRGYATDLMQESFKELKKRVVMCYGVMPV